RFVLGGPLDLKRLDLADFHGVLPRGFGPYYGPRGSRINRDFSLRNRGGSEHGPDICKEGVVAASVSPRAVDVRGRPVEFGPVRVLQPDTEIQPRPKSGRAMAERQIGELEDPSRAVRAPGEGAIKRCVSGAPNRHPPRGKAPRLVINIRSRDIQRSQLVVGIVGESEGLAGAGIVIFVNPGGTHR